MCTANFVLPSMPSVLEWAKFVSPGAPMALAAFSRYVKQFIMVVSLVNSRRISVCWLCCGPSFAVVGGPRAGGLMMVIVGLLRDLGVVVGLLGGVTLARMITALGTTKGVVVVTVGVAERSVGVGVHGLIRWCR